MTVYFVLNRGLFYNRLSIIGNEPIHHHHLDLTTTDARSRSQLFTANVEQLVLETQTSLLVDRNIGDEQGLSFSPTSLTHRLINLPLGPIPHFNDHDLLYEMSSLLSQRQYPFFLIFFVFSSPGWGDPGRAKKKRPLFADNRTCRTSTSSAFQPCRGRLHWLCRSRPCHAPAPAPAAGPLSGSKPAHAYDSGQL